MFEDSNGTKLLIEKQVKEGKVLILGMPFSEYQKIYFSTNENIKEYLKLIDYKNKDNALTVLASGDHTFNLITNEILNIDTFDTNKLTEYYVLGIKRALILKYNYKEYLEILKLLVNKDTSFETINDILIDLLPYMDKKYKEFWKEILDYNYKIQSNSLNKLNLINMLFINVNEVNNLNNYLTNEEEYNKLRININRANISFKCCDAINLHNEFDNKYDLILLSNILDYFYKTKGYNWNIKELNEYINKLNNITNDFGIIFVNYIYNYYSEMFTRNKHLIQSSNINIDNLYGYIVEKMPFYINKYNKKCGDGIILSKKNNKS